MKIRKKDETNDRTHTQKYNNYNKKDKKNPLLPRSFAINSAATPPPPFLSRSPKTLSLTSSLIPLNNETHLSPTLPKGLPRASSRRSPRPKPPTLPRQPGHPLVPPRPLPTEHPDHAPDPLVPTPAPPSPLVPATPPPNTPPTPFFPSPPGPAPPFPLAPPQPLPLIYRRNSEATDGRTCFDTAHFSTTPHDRQFFLFFFSFLHSPFSYSFFFFFNFSCLSSFSFLLLLSLQFFFLLFIPTFYSLFLLFSKKQYFHIYFFKFYKGNHTQYVSISMYYKRNFFSPFPLHCAQRVPRISSQALIVS